MKKIRATLSISFYFIYVSKQSDIHERNRKKKKNLICSFLASKGKLGKLEKEWNLSALFDLGIIQEWKRLDWSTERKKKKESFFFC